MLTLLELLAAAHPLAHLSAHQQAGAFYSRQSIYRGLRLISLQNTAAHDKCKSSYYIVTFDFDGHQRLTWLKNMTVDINLEFALPAGEDIAVESDRCAASIWFCF